MAARRSAGATVGEALLQTSYVSGRQLPHRPMEAWQAARALLAGSPDELRPTAELLRALADPDRLRLVRHLLDQPRTAEELAALTKTESLEVRHQLDRLLNAGVLVVQAEGDEARSQIRPDLVGPLLEFLSAARRPAAPPHVEEAALLAHDPGGEVVRRWLRAFLRPRCRPRGTSRRCGQPRRGVRRVTW